MLCVGPPVAASGISKLIDEFCSSLKEKSIPHSIGHATCLKVGFPKTTNRIRLSPNRGGLSALHHQDDLSTLSICLSSRNNPTIRGTPIGPSSGRYTATLCSS